MSETFQDEKGCPIICSSIINRVDENRVTSFIDQIPQGTRR